MHKLLSAKSATSNGKRSPSHRDDAHNAQGVPELQQGVPGPLAGDDLTVDAAAEARGQVADVDELLHLAHALGQDLALPGGRTCSSHTHHTPITHTHTPSRQHGMQHVCVQECNAV